MTTTLPDAPPRSGQAPLPLAPREGDLVDGAAVTFEWTPLPEARAYRLQVARDDAFAHLLLDAPLAATPVATLYDLLPHRTPVYWRVRAETAEGWQAWSPAVRVGGAPEAAAPTARVAAPARPPAARPAPVGKAAADEAAAIEAAAHEAAAPYHTATTTPRGAAAFIATILLAFLAIVIATFYLSAQIRW